MKEADFISPAPSKVTKESLVFYLGSLMHPKDMIKAVCSSVETDLNLNKRDSWIVSDSKQSEIINIYNSLYKFSLNRLN